MGVGICLANNPHGLQWSPFIENLLLVSCSQRPGHTPTSGILYALEFLPMNDVAIRDQIQLNIGLDLIAASERDENTCVVSCEDNTLRFFDFSNDNSVMFKEWFLQDYRMLSSSNVQYHTKPSALAWDRITLEQILTANGGHNSVDVHSLLLNEEAGLGDVQTDTEQHVLLHCDGHDDVVLDAKWNTHSPFCFMSCDRSGHAYLWDMRMQLSRREGDGESNQSASGGAAAAGGPALKFRLHNNTCAMKMDQNIFDENSLAFACFNQSLMTYDLRMTSRPKAHIANAHYSLMTNVAWSPHTQHLVATSSTDRTMRIWDMRKSNQQAAATLEQQAQDGQSQLGQTSDQANLSDEEMRIDESYGGSPSQFKDQLVDDWVNNCAWNVHEVGLMAICCNDHLVKAYNIRED